MQKGMCRSLSRTYFYLYIQGELVDYKKTPLYKVCRKLSGLSLFNLVTEKVWSKLSTECCPCHGGYCGANTDLHSVHEEVGTD